MGTSVQELLLKAELATVLRIDPVRKQLRDADDRLVAVDIVVVDEAGVPSLVLEFDGVWWHKGNEQKDANKSLRLRTTGLPVVRIREADLEPLDQTFDVQVGFLASAEDVATAVLLHLATLGFVDPAAAESYRDDAFAGPRNRAVAKEWIRIQLGAAALRVERNLHKERWARMYAALVDFEAESAHCYPQDGEVMVEGVRIWHAGAESSALWPLVAG